MQNLLNEIEEIENEYKEFFKNSKVKLIQYVVLSRMPLMLRFNTNLNIQYKLPEEIREKLDAVIMGYYFIKGENTNEEEIFKLL